MAIYTFKQGKFNRAAESIDELLRGRIVRWDSLDELFSNLGFFKHDEVVDVYTAYVRKPAESAQQRMGNWKADIKWVFDVATSDEGLDLILVEDSLPDYLGVLSALSPLVERHKARVDEVSAELSGCHDR